MEKHQNLNDKVKLNFQKGKKLFQTRDTEGFEATLPEGEAGEVILWSQRQALSPKAVPAFEKRLSALASTSLPLAKILGFGVDSNRQGWVLTEKLGGETLLGTKDAGREKGFVRALQIVAALHEKGIVLGDLCGDSFVVDGDGEVTLQSYFGGFDSTQQQTAMIPPKETLYFLAPEQRTGGTPSSSNDVFSLGVLGYKMLTSNFPGAAEGVEGADTLTGRSAAPSSVDRRIPLWVDDILSGCLVTDESGRFADASSVVGEVKKSLQSGKRPGSKSSWAVVNSDSGDKGDSPDQIKESARSNPAETGNTDSQTTSSNKAKDGDSPIILGDAPEEPQEERSLVRLSDPEFALTSKRVNNDLVRKAKSEVGSRRTENDFYGEQTKERGASSSFSSLDIWRIVSTLLCLSIVTVLGLLTYRFIYGDLSTTKLGKGLEIDVEAAPPGLKPSINDLKSAAVTVEVKKEALKRIADFDDPVSHNVLVSVILDSDDPGLKQLSKKLVIERLSKGGLTRSSALLENWFLNMDKSNRNVDKHLVNVLRVFDQTIPLEARQSRLRGLYEQMPEFGLQFAAALGLDTGGDESFTPLLRAFVKEKFGYDDLDDKSVYAIILSEESLLHQFEGDLKSFLKELSENDLAWGMLYLARQNSLALKEVANEVSIRDVVPGFQNEFVKMLAELDHFHLDKNVKLALVRGARGETKLDDINIFGRWYEKRAERALLVVCALVKDKRLKEHAFSTLAGRTLSAEPARTLVSWVKSKYWGRRSRLAAPVSILSLKDIASKQEIETAFDQLAPYFSGNNIFTMFDKIGDSTLTLLALERVGQSLPSEVLVGLLNNKKSAVRIEAVKALGGRNDLSVLHAITKAHKKEKDPEVLQVYEEVHWSTRDR